jgi:hypothetical protein
VAGGFIPILQGWIFVLAGLSIMAPESRMARMALDWAKDKFKRGPREQTGTGTDEEHGCTDPGTEERSEEHERRQGPSGRQAS